jgi:isocitrate dehydrogenase kinase/phosphatase
MSEVSIPPELLSEMRLEMNYQGMRQNREYIIRAIRQQVNRDKAARERSEVASAKRRATISGVDNRP